MKYTRPIHIKLTDLHQELKAVYPEMKDFLWRLFGTTIPPVGSIVPFKLNVTREMHSSEYCDIVDYLVSKFGDARVIYVEIEY